MKTWIRKLLGPAGCSLAAAGTLGLTPSAPAQTHAPAPAGPMGHARPLVVTETPVQAADAYSRLAELKVELAWLSNQATFPFRLAAHVDNGSLEVRGYVPSEAVREQALLLAREQSGMNVLDNLHVHTGLALRDVGRKTTEIEKAAAELLVETFPEHGRSFEVKAKDNGTVIVTGPVPSVEEKLAVSNCLRKIGGCTGVMNQLAVATMTKDGKTFTTVTADGTLMVPGELASHETRPGTVITQTPRMMAPPMQSMTVTPKPEKSMWTPLERTPEMKAEKTPSGYILPGVAPKVADAKPAAKPTTMQPKPLPVSAYADGKTITPAPAAKTYWSYTPPAKDTTTKAAALDKPKAEAVKAVSATAPAKGQYVAKGTIELDKDRYVAKGTIELDDDEPQATPAATTMPVLPSLPPSSAPAPVPAAIKKQIETACGVSARDVEVTVQGSTVVVRLKTRTTDEGNKLAEKILTLPELSAYQVSLDVQVAR